MFLFKLPKGCKIKILETFIADYPPKFEVKKDSIMMVDEYSAESGYVCDFNGQFIDIGIQDLDKIIKYSEEENFSGDTSRSTSLNASNFHDLVTPIVVLWYLSTTTMRNLEKHHIFYLHMIWEIYI